MNCDPRIYESSIPFSPVLKKKVGGARTLAACSGKLSWPRRGVYFFMEPGEIGRKAVTVPASCALARTQRG